ncbi:hypothetical protein KM043_008353 [Ampulex compressa]|nr:hypothetical protein KM043_008353 [Ampulex compressa]
MFGGKLSFPAGRCARRNFEADTRGRPGRKGGAVEFIIWNKMLNDPPAVLRFSPESEAGPARWGWRVLKPPRWVGKEESKTATEDAGDGFSRGRESRSQGRSS